MPNTPLDPNTQGLVPKEEEQKDQAPKEEITKEIEAEAISYDEVRDEIIKEIDKKNSLTFLSRAEFEDWRTKIEALANKTQGGTRIVFKQKSPELTKPKEKTFNEILEDQLKF